jgi:long-subunit fatty acid transport protein
MKRSLGLAALAAMAASGVTAGGIDRSGQDYSLLFEPGTAVRIEFGSVSPSLSGRDKLGNPIANVGRDFTQTQVGFKSDVNARLSYGLILDQPYGADVAYGGSSATTMFGGTSAQAESAGMTALLRYKFNERMSVHGGLKAQSASANVTLRGLAYGGLSGYNVALAEDNALGYVVGAAYEIPEIKLRAALTYSSAITHDFATVEKLGTTTIGTSTTTVETPQSVNLDLQSGVAKDTLVFGQIRWVDWSSFRLDPKVFTPLAKGGLIDLEDTTTYTLGVGRRFNDSWAGLFSLSYEAAGDPLVSPLAPTTGLFGATIGAVYTHEKMKVTFGVNYTQLGDASPETGTPDVARADFSDNDAVGFGLRLDYTF